MATAMVASSALQQLATSLKRSASQEHMATSTHDFVATVGELMPFFAHLGPVLGVAKVEFSHKLQTLQAAAARHPTLADVVAHDRAAGAAAAKNSPTRNLHRLVAAIQFIQLLLERLMASPQVTLHEAASHAYDATLAPFHTALIRGVVRAGMLTLPSRAHFIAELGETEESAAPRCGEVVASCSAIAGSVSKLLAGIEFPVSDVWFWPSG
ncbi:hypothetical protein Rsub_12152 [Raphidocelis subcapitata]|uniref:Glycolipid transfer protein domain-containing protein n=1 Tax=Raphidocelis subcapitata TaxID=307507 RepID=A0A2V0PI56_9CHLO|nr:hypothetical protein Rsub_12152 [Raphidocelis subcapitata]|eukprot:GBF99484.1 hypothetical protein Rsub_12152 [Raphidocelis subcapitata]